MPVPLKFLIFQLLIFLPFIAGILCKRYFTDPPNTAKRIIRTNLVAVEPLVALWSIWGLRLSINLLYLPCAGLLLVVAGFFAGIITAPAARLTEKSRATYIISSSLANHGFTMGGFLCYLFIGERGLALSFIFLVYFMPFVFMFIFPYAKAKTHSGDYRVSEFLCSLQNMPLLGVFLGLALNVAGIMRPKVYFPMEILILISMSLYYFTLGLTVTLEGLRSCYTSQILLSLAKFIVLPAVTLAVLRIIPVQGEVAAVIALESFMPAAIYSVIASILFDLDIRLASSLFIVNTVIFLAAVLPLLMLFRGTLLGL